MHVGFNLMPAILSHCVDAILGFANDEAVRLALQTHGTPTVLTVDKLGVPTYAELVLVANSKRLGSDRTYAATVDKFVKAYLAAARAAQRDSATAVAIMRKATHFQQGFVERAVPQTLNALTPSGGKALGCLSQAGWQQYISWMVRNKLLSKPMTASRVISKQFVRSVLAPRLLVLGDPIITLVPGEAPIAHGPSSSRTVASPTSDGKRTSPRTPDSTR